ncbi:unnamed protein product [Triticum turgidum subsp. durum]|uniref:Sulfotransferase n=1 Tax=Triticum turgidum subsp. durum TaxID=4567 RepID=A0A9R1RQ69_TRITD|nr:unnamed protein product [Triticum turgidum subsp. durum]
MSSSSSIPTFPPQEGDAETNEELYGQFTELVSSWPCSRGLSRANQLYRHEKGWYSTLPPMVGAMVADARFAARPSDIVVATMPKSGTTWMKALLYSTVNRKEHPPGGPGPYWDHALGYWRAHLANPERVLFFRYEEMSRDPAAHVRRLAEFVGRPFSAEEEEDGAVDAVVKLCSFEHMTGLEVTKSGKTELVLGAVENSSFFRRGLVGDWENYLSPETARKIDAITEAKFRGFGLSV